MDVSEFQNKLSELVSGAAANNKTVSAQEVERAFSGADLSKEQVDRIFQYLRIRGIEVTQRSSGNEDPADNHVAEEFVIDTTNRDKETAAKETALKDTAIKETAIKDTVIQEAAVKESAIKQTDEEVTKETGRATMENAGDETSPSQGLSSEDQEYLEDYLSHLPEDTAFPDKERLFQRLNEGDDSVIHPLTEYYLRTAAEMAVRLKSENILLPDLIQEANLGLFEALSDTACRQKNDQWVRAKILAGIRKAIEDQELCMDADRALVERVERLEASIRDLMDEEDQDLKFSIGELAVILDMEEDEIRDILNLTGDGNES